MLRFNAWNLARSWASVALAQGEDDSRPVLYRTTLIEIFPEGIRLLSTDTFVLLKAWVTNLDHEDAPEPLIEELPMSVAICRDLDHRVLGMMKYAQKITKDDGLDTRLSMEFAIGDQSAEGNTLEGLAASTVHFRIVEKYDESIETPVFEGAYPNWRPMWAGHKWAPASAIGFGANGILRLGNLSKLWDKAVIRFELGGNIGVAKIRIEGPSDVNVTGLVMPTGRPGEDDPVPPSTEGTVDGEMREFSEAFDDWYTELLRTETTDDDEVGDLISEAFDSQVRRAAEFAITAGYVTARSVGAAVGVSENAAEVILDALIEDQIVNPPLVGTMDGKYIIAVAELPEHYRIDDPVTDGDDDPTAGD